MPLNFGARGGGSYRNPFTWVELLPDDNITDRHNIRANGIPDVASGSPDVSRPRAWGFIMQSMLRVTLDGMRLIPKGHGARPRRRAIVESR